ncbi:AAA family ATPase [Nocardioides bruguierae]|uniref:AAA family ATPase n=1 Tax=Nocardioides bruguierae TaxID=2945102 RepID=UPI00201FE827|nr:AAA family ATPase [Nocardioides bruguierae]MCL8027510.1 AAA family ATPase [Nocardioides bruguierae]
MALPAGRVPVLLAALVDAHPHAVPEADLLASVWPGEEPGRRALQVLVSRVRGATSTDAVVHGAGGYRCGLPPDQVDALALERHLRGAEAAWAAGDAGTALAAARSVLALGDLAGDDAPGPLGGLRSSAARRCERAADVLGPALLARGEADEALPLLRARAETGGAATPEPVLVAYVRATAQVEGTAAALALVEDLRARLADELGTDLGPGLAQAHATLLAADRPVRTGLRHAATSLVGRADDLAQVRALLEAHRVVTVLGPGGLGKTRLAQEVAAVHPAPVVRFVELVGLPAGQDVLPALAAELGVRESAWERRVLTPRQRADVRALLAQHLDGPETLLVLDNCEHVVDSVAEVAAQLVALCPRLRVLTTSRSPLRVAAERVHELGVLSGDDAAALFVERALAVRPGARLEAADVRAVVSRLDGLPLAIELAAAKVRVLALPDLARRLEDRLATLRGDDRGAPDRHRTLLAVLDWSWALLDEPARRAWRRLAVLPDGFALPAAEALVGADALERVDDLLAQSLLVPTETTAGLRYRMLETVRELGLLRAREADDLEDAREAMTGWAVALADEVRPGLFAAGELDAVDALATDESTLAEALRRSLASGATERVLRLLAALGGLWTVRGEHTRVIALVDDVERLAADWGDQLGAGAVHATDDLLDAALLAATVMVRNGLVAAGRGLVGCQGLLHVAAARVEDGPGPVRSSWALANARVLDSLDITDLHGSLDRAATLLDHPDARTASLALEWSGHGRENYGDPTGALVLVRRALALWVPEHGPWSRAQLLTQLVQLLAQTGDTAGAATAATEALPVLERLGAADDVVQLRAAVASAALVEGDLVGARRIADGLAASADVGIGARMSVRPLLAELDLAEGRVTEGLARFRAALDDVRAISFPVAGVDPGREPWTLSLLSATTAAHARFAADPEDVRAGERLAGELRLAVVAEIDEALATHGALTARTDMPVLATCLVGLAAWGAHQGPDETLGQAAVLMGVARSSAHRRPTPSLAWEPVVAVLAARGAPALADPPADARRLLEQAGAALSG